MRYRAHGSAGAYRSATPPAGEPGPKLVFQQVDDPQTVTKNRLHLDIIVGDEIRAETDRLLGLGATKVSELIEEVGTSWIVLADPRATSSAWCTTHEPARAIAFRVQSNGAPSARNLLVTVFGDALLPHGAEHRGVGPFARHPAGIVRGERAPRSGRR